MISKRWFSTASRIIKNTYSINSHKGEHYGNLQYYS